MIVLAETQQEFQQTKYNHIFFCYQNYCPICCFACRITKNNIFIDKVVMYEPYLSYSLARMAMMI